MLLLTGTTLLLLACTSAAPINKASEQCSGRADGFYADYEQECRQFYRCAAGKLYSFSCNKGTKFDEKVRACVLEAGVSCLNPNARKVQESFDCSGKDDGFYADESDCSVYHRCSGGIATIYDCADGTKFDEGVNACILAEMARCNKPSARALQIDCSGKEDGFYANQEDDCSSYSRCSNSIATSYQCPEGSKFDEGVNACVLADMARCGSKSARSPVVKPDVSNFDCSSLDGYFADRRRDCRQFYFCHGGKKELYFCAPGTRFDENQRACMPENEVACEVKRGPSHSPPEWLDFSCSDLKDGFYADRYRDCRVFYRCINGEKVNFVCGPGTQFDDKSQTCVHQGPDVCPTPDNDVQGRQIKFRKLRTLLTQLRDMIKEKKHR